MDWSLGDFVLAAVLVVGTGLLFRLAARGPRRRGYLAVALVIAIAAMALGEADDAPGLVLFGCVVMAGTVALAVRTAQRAREDQPS